MAKVALPHFRGSGLLSKCEGEVGIAGWGRVLSRETARNPDLLRQGTASSLG